MTQAPPEARTSEQRLQMSYEEFLAWPEDIHAEWVDGEVIIFMPPKTIHQLVFGFLYKLLSFYADLFKLGTVISAPFEMRILDGQSSREPDLLFLAQEHHDRLTPERLDGPADLVVELISDSSVARDRADKFYEYQAAGVREYWIIDPRPGKQRLDCYQLLPDGNYQAILPDDAGRYHSAVLAGFWLNAAWLWQEPLPDPLRTMAEIRGLSPEATQALLDMLKGTQSQGDGS